MTAFRVEKDSLGELQVPADAYYGVQTARAVQNFPVSGLRPYRAFIWSMAALKRAAAEVNDALELFQDREIDGKSYTGHQVAEAIQRAAAEVMDGQWDAQFVVDPFQAGAGTSHNMNTNEVIANRATELLGGQAGKYIARPNDDVNMAQSTNDTIPTAIRLGCLWRLDEFLSTVDALVAAFQQKAAEFDDVVKSGRTHLQDAVPVRLGQEFGAYARAIQRDRERIAHAAEGLRRLGIGGTATGTGLNAHPEYHRRMVQALSAITGLELRESDNLFESMQSLADAVDFSASLRTLCVTLDRICNDLRLLSSGPATGLDEIRLPAVQPGSSIMPGKVNPVMAEMLNMACFHVMGNDLCVMMAGQAGQLELNVMMPIIAYNLFQSMDVLIGGIRAFTNRCVVGITANREKAQGWLAKNAILVTALNPIIGYLKGAEVAKEAMARNIPVRQVVIEKGYLTEAEVDQVLDVRTLTYGGIQAGGAGGGG